MVDETETGDVATVGERLRAAREAQGIDLEDVATRTRIPTRHLQSLEVGEWSKLPAPTYCVGFAKSYASAIGLDRTEIGDQLRAEMSGFDRRATHAPEVFEPADPARVMPRWLVLLAVLGVVLVVAGLLYARSREISGPDAGVPAAEAPQAAAATGAAPTAVAAPGGPVVITANEPAWIQVYERGGGTLFQGELATGQSYEVPATAAAPLLKTGRPQALRVAVGTADAPPVGRADTTVRDVSLKPADLLRGPGTTPPAQSAPEPR
jgi:cytoskeletal protein RodZ